MKTIQILQWLENFKGMNDKQLQKFAKQQQLDFSLEEIKELRKILSNASISWGIYGIPKKVQEEVEQLIGTKRYKKLLKTIGL
ncbi:isopropylmalate synthase [Solibacillus silvestris]|uniref:isopropylmalate synthase n=1 Tax=Solibacillus silvestris TaxID=76853 RepID=UPI003F81D878